MSLSVALSELKELKMFLDFHEVCRSHTCGAALVALISYRHVHDTVTD